MTLETSLNLDREQVERWLATMAEFRNGLEPLLRRDEEVPLRSEVARFALDCAKALLLEDMPGELIPRARIELAQFQIDNEGQVVGGSRLLRDAFTRFYRHPSSENAARFVERSRDVDY